MPCWWARTIVPSMIVYSKSRSLDKASKRLSNTPYKGPAAEAPEDRIPKPERVGKIAPGCTRAGDPEHGFEEAPVVGRRSSWGLRLVRRAERKQDEAETDGYLGNV